jgi:hypothetical protein
MDIRAEVKEHLHQVLQQDPGAGPVSFQVQWPGGRLRVELTDVQPIGCALWQLEVHTRQTEQASAEHLQQAGQRLADRVRYLLEPLHVHEVDPLEAAVQLRSSPPQRDARSVSYYEVTAQRDGGWRLVRYEKQPEQPRQQVAALVTSEVLQRVCQDVVEIASQ